MKSLLIRQGRVIDPSQGLDQVADVLIVTGKVAAVGPQAAGQAPANCTHLVVAGRVVCPGFIDMHVHLREPGQTGKETIATGTAAAARGGFTAVLCMPNTSPVVDSPSLVASIHERSLATGRVNVFVAGAISKGLEGEELAAIGALKQAGVVAISDDGHCVQNNELMRRVMEYSTMFGLPVLDHCEDRALVTDGVAHEGRYSTMLGLRGWPAAGEEVAVARDILLAERTGARLHCQHLSAAGSVRLVREARQRGLPVTAEACPHHFTLTDAALAGSDEFWGQDGEAILSLVNPSPPRPAWPAYDTNFKINPPLRSARDRKAILDGLADGTITVIASDHAPHGSFEKEVEFDYAPFGITGLETAVPLALMQLYHAGRLPLGEVIARFTTGPAQVLQLADKGTLRVGADGDVTVLDPDIAWVFQRGDSASKSANSPFYGWSLRGRAVATVVGGSVVWRGDRAGEPGSSK
jgi:dihydroorotase